MYMEYFLNYLLVFGVYVGYITIISFIIIGLKHLFKIKDYIYRKLLHLVAVTSIFPLVLLSQTFWIALLVCLTLIIGITVGLLIFEPLHFYDRLFIEKKKHETILSFALFYITVSALIALFWGAQGDGYKYIIYTSIVAWGFGDAFAAMIGISVGKPNLQGRFIEGHKSIAGCVAMFTASAISSFVVLMIFGPYVWYFAILIALAVGVVATFAELFTRFNLDNFTVTFMVALLLFLISLI